MERDGARFYKLNKRRRYGVEGTQFNKGEAILLGVVLALFLSLAIAQIIVNADVLFRDSSTTVSILGFLIISILISTVAFSRYVPVIKRIRRARKILKNCILTDGTVTELRTQRMQRMGTRYTHTYDLVVLNYAFCAPDGSLREGEYCGKYAYVPFFRGQNLMIAFNGSDSVILNKFTLSEGAEEFECAEAERELADFSSLTGKQLKVDTTKPIAIADYSWSMVSKNAKRNKRLALILSGNPSFATGRFFIKKSTYRRDSGNGLFYCYIDKDGAKHVEECAGICGLNDGDEVTVAYGGGLSEIVAKFTLKKTGRVKK